MHHGKEEKTSMKLFRNKPFLNCVNDICKQMTHPTIKCTATIQHQTLNSIYKRVNWNNFGKGGPSIIPSREKEIQPNYCSFKAFIACSCHFEHVH